MAIEVMKEIRIDISQHRSKIIDEFYGLGIETVVTVCDAANKACPLLSRSKRSHSPKFTGPFGIHWLRWGNWAGFHKGER